MFRDIWNARKCNGEIAHGRYIAGITFMCCRFWNIFYFLYMDLFTDRIVAEFSGRPRLAESLWNIITIIRVYSTVTNYRKKLKKFI
jgi:hypothetical protein